MTNDISIIQIWNHMLDQEYDLTLRNVWKVPQPWWLRSTAPIVTQTNQIYVYMEVARGRFREMYVYIALQASPYILWHLQLIVDV